MDFLLLTFNNRELAALIWGMVLLVVLAASRNVRLSLVRLLCAFFRPKILLPLLLMLAYMSAVVWGLWKLHLWDPVLLKDSIVWVMSVGFVLFLHSPDAHHDERYFRQTVITSLKVVVVLEFLANLHVFSFWCEIALFPIVLALVLMKTVAEFKPDLKGIERALGTLLIVYGLVVLVFSTYHALKDIRGTFTFPNLQAILLQPALTMALVPFLYAFALVAAYELLFVRIDFFNRESGMAPYFKRRALRKFHMNLLALNRWARGRGLWASSEAEVDRLLQ